MKKKLLTLICTAALTAGMAMTALAGTWQPDGNLWWYQEDDGSYPAATWKSIDGVWYHFNAAGYMETGWVNDNGTWYYMEQSGAMRTAPLTENGLTYYFDGSGACTNPEGSSEIFTDAELDELGYSVELLGWLAEIVDVSEGVENWPTLLETGQFDQVKSDIQSSKATFGKASGIVPPEKYAAAHAELIAGCNDYIASLDIMYNLVDGLQNETLTEEAFNQMSAQYDAYLASYEAHFKRFNELASAIQ